MPIEMVTLQTLAYKLQTTNYTRNLKSLPQLNCTYFMVRCSSIERLVNNINLSLHYSYYALVR